MEILREKLEKAIEHVFCINHRKKIDLTTSPSHPRVSFPYPDITPHAQVLDKATLAQRLGIDPVVIQAKVSTSMDVSSNPEGVCQVTAAMYLVTNSHAGSHADQPSHWLANPPFESFDERQYNGIATVLDLTEYLKHDKAITSQLLQIQAQRVGVNLQTLSRLFVRTYDCTPSEWDPNFAYLTPEAGTFLGQLPNLLLLATDAPSVDHPKAAPIHAQAHGGLWAGRVAILEGYESNLLVKGERLEGVVQTTLLETPGVKDAKYAVITFYPLE